MILQATPEEAIELLKNKTDPASRHSLAIAYRTLNQLDASQEIAFDLWQKDGFREPELALLISNLFLDCGNYVRSEEWATNAWQLQAPEETPEFALPLAMARMRLGMWDRLTWHLWEIGREGKSWNVVPGTKRWRGERDLDYDPVLVLSEGGYGDAFLYSRFLPEMQDYGTMFWGPQFAPLKSFSEDWGIPSIWADEPMPNLSSYKYSTGLMSFMATLNVKSPAEIPAAEDAHVLRHQYALAPVFQYREKKLGLCWRAEENAVQKRSRSIMDATELDPLAEFGDMVSLCPGESLSMKSKGGAITQVLAPQIKDWRDTARIIAGLDCVVSVDTAVLHLAGLLGVPAIGILPLSSDWKWSVDTDKSYWWPSLTIVRNTSPYTFRPAIEKVAELLEKM